MYAQSVFAGKQIWYDNLQGAGENIGLPWYTYNETQAAFTAARGSTQATLSMLGANTAGAYADGVACRAAIRGSANMELLFRWRVEATTENIPGIWARGDGTYSGTVQSRDANCAWVEFVSPSGTLQYVRSVAGSGTVVASTTVSLTNNADAYLRVAFLGPNVYAKAWMVSTAEPPGWDLTTATETTLLAGTYFGFGLNGGASATSDYSGLFQGFWAWDLTQRFAVVNQDPVGTNAPAQVAIAAGVAHFESSGGSSSITLTATDAVYGYGTAYNPGVSSRTTLGAPPTGVGTAYNAGVNVGGVAGFAAAVTANSVLTYATDPAASTSELVFNFITGSLELVTPSVAGSSGTAATALAAGVGTANNATVTVTSAPTALVAVGVGSAANAVGSTTVGNTIAGVATGSGTAAGVDFLLDENGDQLLDEDSEPLITGGLTVKIALGSGVATAAGAANVASTKASTTINAATATGSALQPSITAGSGSVNANANAVPALGSAAAQAAAVTLVSHQVGVASGVGAAIAPSVTTTGTTNVNPAAGVSSGVANAATVSTQTATPVVTAMGVGSAIAPSVQTVSGSSDANVNAATATGSGAANSATTTAATSSTYSAGTGTVPAATFTLEIPGGGLVATGVAHDPQTAIITGEVGYAPATGAAYDAQVDINAFNFASVAAIPIAATAIDANISIAVNAVPANATGIAPRPNQFPEDPGQLVTLRDSGHTVTCKER